MSHRAEPQGRKDLSIINLTYILSGRTQKFPRARILFVYHFSRETRTLVNNSATYFFQSIVVCTVLLKYLWNNGLNSPVPNRNFQLLLTNPKYCFLVCWVSLKRLGASYYPTPGHLSLTTNLARRTLFLYQWPKLCHTSTKNQPLVRKI